MKVQHSNNSSHSINENLYDVSISTKVNLLRSLPKKRFLPRRVGLLLCLNNIHEDKRPSEYYLAKMTHPPEHTLSGPNTNTNMTLLLHLLLLSLLLALQEKPTPSTTSHPRPASDSSVSFAETGKDSDDAVLVVSTPFDVQDSRLSYMTNYSTYSSTKTGDGTTSLCSSTIPSSLGGADPDGLAAAVRPQISPIVEGMSPRIVGENENCDQLNLSLTTITLKGHAACPPKVGVYNVPVSDLPPLPPQLRSASTSAVIDLKRQPPCHNQLRMLSQQASVGSPFVLARSKTRYYNLQETKKRKQLRKKLYEENDDDELLMNEMDFVFNVPVIKNHGEIYRTRKTESAPNMLLSRDDIVMGGDNNYSYKPTESMRPCPLPGKLSSSNLSVDRIPTSIPETRALVSDEILESDETQNSTFTSLENDSEICNNISHFYTQRSLSYSTLVRASRAQHMTNRLPDYVKSHSSIEDLRLISPEKLDVVDQSRPINLPPKNTVDKAKHHRELHRVTTEFGTTTKHASSVRENLGLLAVTNQQDWLKLMVASEEKDFERKLNHDREIRKLRKLNWKSLVSGRFRFDYYMKVLMLNTEKGFVDSAAKKLAELEKNLSALSHQMRAVKDSEFNGMIDYVFHRPLFKNYLMQMHETESANFDFDVVRENFRRLLYLKSLSEGGLQKHHQIFVIPTFLILFHDSQSFEDIWTLIELFDKQIFSSEVFDSLNKNLSSWSDLSRMSQSSPVCKILKKFSSLREFEDLSSTSLFELIIQLNDRLPLSLNAPSTPIFIQSLSKTQSKSSLEMEGSAQSDSVNSLGSIADWESEAIYSASSTLSLVGIFLQLLVIYSRSEKRNQKAVNLFQGFLLTIFQYYHINWNSCGELVKANKSIKLNNSSDQLMNLESFLNKWRRIFKSL